MHSPSESQTPQQETARTNMNNEKMQIRGREAQSRETWDSKAESLTPSLAWFLPCFKIQGQLCR